MDTPVGSTARSPGASSAASVVTQIGPGVAGVRVRRERHVGVDAPDQHVDRGHGDSRVHLEGAGAPDLVRVGHRRLDLLRAAVVDEVVDLDLDEEGVGADRDGPVGAADPAVGGASRSSARRPR